MVLCRQPEYGFAEVGIAPAQRITYDTELIQWLKDSKHGEMYWLESRYLEQRLDPVKLLPGCKALIMFADRYSNNGDNQNNNFTRSDNNSPTGRIARYAQGKDYHKHIKKRLLKICDILREKYPDHKFQPAVDTAPVMEREHAARAGLGYVGKNTLLIQPGIGSYFFVCEILTTLPLEPERPENIVTDHCGSCTRCIDACPTNAITPYSVDATKCISYLTIEHRSAINSAYYQPIDNWIFGCDICQEVCPHNGDTELTRNAPVNEAYQPVTKTFDLLQILDWEEDDRRRAFTNSAMKRAKLDMIKRNALIAAGNYLQQHGSLPDNKSITKIQQIANDENDIVKETAREIYTRVAGIN